MTETYRTVAERASIGFERRGSEFLAHAAPVDSIDDAEAFIAEIEDEYADATHNVPAYRVPAGAGSDRTPTGDVMLREYASDDGEPTGTAGKPALNVLQQRDVRNVVVVVTRYYGGTNLGAGGLARAYSGAVKEAIDAAGIVEEEPHRTLTARCEYDDSGTVRGVIASSGFDFEADYEEAVVFWVRVPLSRSADLEDRLRSATSGRVDLS